MICKARGRHEVSIFKRTIPKEKVADAGIVVVISVALVALSSVIVSLSIDSHDNRHFTMLQSFFESASAFGTIGFSMGITSDVNVAGQMCLLILMFIGQLSVSNTILL
jgi:Trk-type K+ transport system membrane component